MSKYIDGLRCGHPKWKWLITYETDTQGRGTGRVYTDCGGCGARLTVYGVHTPKNRPSTYYALSKNIDKEEHVKSYTIRTTNNVGAYRAKRRGQQFC